MTPPPSVPEAPPAASQRLGLFSIVALGMNTIVGSGIFALPSELARAMGTSSPLAFVAAAAILAVIAVAFAVCARVVPGGAGPYAYARAAFGPAVGSVVAAWVYAGIVTTWATTCAAIPAQLDALVPGAGAHPRLLATAFVLATGIANLSSVRAGRGRSPRWRGDAGRAGAAGALPVMPGERERWLQVDAPLPSGALTFGRAARVPARAPVDLGGPGNQEGMDLGPGDLGQDAAAARGRLRVVL